jgi:protocatechuate 3,4-dioxygenase beta subunit
MQLNRRDLLAKCAALGAITLAPSLSVAAATEGWLLSDNKARPATPAAELGPFYKRGAPNTAMLRGPNDPGMPLTVAGVVYNTRGEILPGAKLEIWQTDHTGHYDLQGYRYRSVLVADSAGKYDFSSVMPGHYPARVCQHIHYAVTATGHKPMVTQLYFASDPVFEGNPDKNYTKDPLITSRELVRPVMLKGDPQVMLASVNFEIVLEQA